MTALFLLLASGMQDDAAKARERDKEGVRLAGEGKYEEAVREFDAALQIVGAENAQLSWRDGDRYDKYPYYPYLNSGLARVRQAEAAASPETKRDRLKNAITRLEKSKHADAAAALKSAREKLAKVEEEIRRRDQPPDPFPAKHARLKKRLERLCGEEKYEEALRAVEEDADTFRDHEKEKREDADWIRGQQRSAIDGRKRALDAQLELVEGKPLANSPQRLDAIGECLIPPAMAKAPGGEFEWAARFVDSWKKHASALDKPDAMEDGALLDVAGEFDALAAGALQARYFNGFRAARMVAHTLRLLRMESLLGGVENAWRRAKAVAEAEAKAHGDIAKPLAAAGPEGKQYLNQTLPAQRKRVSDIADRLPGPDMEVSIEAAEKALSDPETVIDPGKLLFAAKSLAAMEENARFGNLSPALRARALFAWVLLRATAGFLQGEGREEMSKDCGEKCRRAYALNAEVDKNWRICLSPKILTLIDEMRKRE